MENIFVIAEHRQGEIRDITFEMLNLGNSLAKENDMTVTSVLLGKDTGDIQEKLQKASDRVLVMDAPELADYNADYYLAALEGIIKEKTPRLVLIGHTSAGMDLAPPLSVRTGAPLATDCMDVRLTGDTLEATRQVFGGKINAELSLKPSATYMVTVRPGCFPDAGDLGKSAETDTIPVPEWTNLRGRHFLEYLTSETEDVDIAAADILVSVGRGIGKPENIPMVEEFATAIGATVSCSRPVADKEWLPKSRQVGVSGKTVKPKIYIALGISGAFQHQAGMKNADTIIAVNTDAAAPIFSVAHYGIVGDLLQVIPVLTEKFKNA
ncbi:electron transfer flavoprotein subunit alpha/FixB family protein [Desulfonema magnum]|uniref:Electron transfer flavoprotein, subunit alpha n=1 Tax=Desulfonema magnum TaxID=45655 RepID=A0A975GQH6_9BACT|nr:electron transfer flavoprotein subunit alpha/FixB family protein [Desulfonema magnum]QTA90056.1 Electron transfer flavoprotein, subunit alpha [Desulfonema magnum]